MSKPPPGDKTLGFETEIRFYDIEDGKYTEEGEESEILVIHDSSLAVYKKNLVNRRFPYIDTFDHERPSVLNEMQN